MNSSLKKFGLALLILVTCVYFYEKGKQQPIHWYETFNNRDKNPYGLYIFDQEVEKLVQTKHLSRFSYAFFTFLYQPDYDTLKTSNLILLAGGHAELDDYTAKHLKAYIASGNTAFIQVENPKDSFVEAFGLKNGDEIEGAFGPRTDGVLALTNESLTKQRFSVKNSLNPRSFEILDSVKDNVEILGYRLVNDSIKQVNLVRIKHGKGELILGSSPLVFTNYYLLESNNHLYVESVLSYLPAHDTTYMHVLKSGEMKESSSLLRFIFAHPPLQWAWYFFLFGLLVFTLFTAKRKQRIIPIIPTVKNTTVEFTKTVSNLYIQSKDYKDLIDKSIVYALEKIRRIYYIDTTVLDEKFVHHYQLKTNKNKADIFVFINIVNEFRQPYFLATEADLVRLHQAIKKILD